MDSTNRTLIVIMIIILVIVGLLLFAPRRYAYVYPTGTYYQRAAATSFITRHAPASASVISKSYTYIPGRVEYIPGNTQVCSMDARQCPDGSYVGRIGPSCSFASCR